MDDVGLRALPAVLQADGELPRPPRRRRRTAGTTVRSCSSAGRRPTRCSARSSRPRQQAGYPLHRRRQRLPAGGLRAVRPQHPPRPPALGRPRLPAPGDAPAEPRRRARGRSSTRVLLRGQARGRRRVPRAGRRRRAGQRRRGRSSAAARSTRPQLLQLSGVGDAADLRGARHRRGRTTCPGVGENLQDHLEVYIQYACKQPVSIAAGPEVALPAVDRRRLAVPAPRPRRHQPLRGRRLRPQQRRRRLPEPDVPLPADRGPLRRLVAGRAATATRCTSGRCTPTPAAR